ncbi:MAG: hypothetical protein Salg2KO_04950 [Salibacteraceae bacterium]
MALSSCSEPSFHEADPSPDLKVILDSIKGTYEADPHGSLLVVEDMIEANGQRLGKNSSLMCLARARMASILGQIGEIDSAITIYTSVVDQCDDDRELLIMCLNNRASLLLRAGDHSQALSNLRRVESMVDANLEYDNWRSVLQTTSAVYFELGQYDSSVVVAGELLNKSILRNDSLGISAAYETIGSSYLELGEDRLASRSLKKSLEYLPKEKSKRDKMFLLVNIGAMHDYSNRFDSAQHYYNLAENIAEELGAEDVNIHLLKNYAYLDYGRGKFESAFNKLEKANERQEQWLSEESAERISELEFRFENKEKKAEIARLIHENRISALQRNFFIVLAFLLLALATSAILIYSNRIRSQRLLNAQHIAQLEKEKEVMSLQSMLFAQEEERQRIARDLHDSIGALLSTAKLHISNIEMEVQKLVDLNFLRSTEEVLDRASLEVRRVAHDMMPGVLMKLGLFEGIEDYFDRVRNSSDIVISFTYDELNERLDNKHEVMIYRMVQELVNNTLKHAEAGEIKLMMKVVDDILVVDYRDDGKGMDVQLLENPRSFGLAGLKSRARFLHGDLTVQSEPSQGVHYTIMIPIG